MWNYLPWWSCDSQPYWFSWCLHGCCGCESVNNSALFFIYRGKLNILPLRNSELAQFATRIFIFTVVYDLVKAVSPVKRWTCLIFISSVRTHHKVFHTQHFGWSLNEFFNYNSILKWTRLLKILPHTLWIKTIRIDRQVKVSMRQSYFFIIYSLIQTNWYQKIIAFKYFSELQIKVNAFKRDFTFSF